MTSDELQKFASLLRWVGLGVTAVGLIITFGSHFIADRLLSVQRSDKVKAQERMQASEAELHAIKNRVGGRRLPTGFAEVLVGRSAGSAEIVFRDGDDEAYEFATTISDALLSAGWTVASPVSQMSKTENAGLPFMLREAGVSAGDWSKVAVLTRGPLVAEPYDGPTPLDALMNAFVNAGVPALHLIPHESLRPATGVVRIVVGARL